MRWLGELEWSAEGDKSSFVAPLAISGAVLKGRLVPKRNINYPNMTGFVLNMA